MTVLEQIKIQTQVIEWKAESETQLLRVEM